MGRLWCPNHSQGDGLLCFKDETLYLVTKGLQVPHYFTLPHTLWNNETVLASSVIEKNFIKCIAPSPRNFVLIIANASRAKSYRRWAFLSTSKRLPCHINDGYSHLFIKFQFSRFWFCETDDRYQYWPRSCIQLGFLYKRVGDLLPVVKDSLQITGARDQNSLWMENCLTLRKAISSWLLGKIPMPEKNCFCAGWRQYVFSENERSHVSGGQALQRLWWRSVLLPFYFFMTIPREIGYDVPRANVANWHACSTSWCFADTGKALVGQIVWQNLLELADTLKHSETTTTTFGSFFRSCFVAEMCWMDLLKKCVIDFTSLQSIRKEECLPRFDDKLHCSRFLPPSH